ncbi:hypothetical protein [Phenylobacterium sp.]|uniref:hypothetical protein n=1 Tax=Phenylobacterium sp. TaxID=1871053 RepID=UPI003BA99A4C
MSQRRVAGRNVRPVALGASVVFHAVLLLVLARFLAHAPIHAEAPVDVGDARVAPGAVGPEASAEARDRP